MSNYPQIRFASILMLFLSMTAHAQTTPCTAGALPLNLQDGLLFYTPFCGTPNDMGPQTYSGVNSGASQELDRFLQPNSALWFNGTSSFVDYGQASGLLGMDSMTICFWLAPESNPSNGQAVILGNLGPGGGSGCGYQCYVEVATGKLVFEYRHSLGNPLGHFARSTEAVPNDVWTFYSVMYYRNGSTGVVSLYRNSQLDTTYTFDNSINYQNPGSFRLGTNIDIGLGERFFKGKIDDIMIYNRVLSLSELEQVQSGEVQTPCISAAEVTMSGLNTSYYTTDAPSNLLGIPEGGVFFGPGVSGSEFNPAVSGAGTHTVVYTYVDQNGCVNSIGQCTAVSLGIGINEPNRMLNDIHVYPNPTEGTFTVELELQGIITIVAHDNRGRQVLNQTFMAQGMKTTRLIDLSLQPTGTYILQIETAGGSVSQQLIKQ
ncbi:MAG: LamG-like jellyroll fold domain-containing protein [Flavobacteriales bacterium]